MEEYFFVCPHCVAEISMLIDLSVDEQSYIEDCEVCCNPIEIAYKVSDYVLAWFTATPLEQ